jgi:hypothetical protein
MPLPCRGLPLSRRIHLNRITQVYLLISGSMLKFEYRVEDMLKHRPAIAKASASSIDFSPQRRTQKDPVGLETSDRRPQRVAVGSQSTLERSPAPRAAEPTPTESAQAKPRSVKKGAAVSLQQSFSRIPSSTTSEVSDGRASPAGLYRGENLKTGI